MKQQEWTKIRKKYIFWLSTTKLKKIFSENFVIDNYSTWWSTKLVDKDIILDQSWFRNFKDLFFYNKIIIKKNIIYLLFFKLFIKFLLQFFKIFILKFFFKKTKFYKSNYTNCYLSDDINIIKYQNNNIDRQYGIAPMNTIKNNCYLIKLEKINLNYLLSIIKNNKFRSLKADYYILETYIGIFDAVRIYYLLIIFYIKLNKIMKKDNSFFKIDNKDFSTVLKPLLLDSFFGYLQENMLRGIALRKFLDLIKVNNLITYGEFFPGQRSLYHYSRISINRPLVISIQHAVYSKNNLFYNITKKEFSKKNESLLYSPSPDVFFTQGLKYFNFLKKIFPHNSNIFPIGSFKVDLINYKKKILKKKNYILKIKKNYKYLILICPAMGDEDNIINFFNKLILCDFFFLIVPHPYFIKQTTNKFNINFKNKYLIIQNVLSRDIFDYVDYVVCGYSSITYEAILEKKKVFRVSDNSYINIFDNPDFDILTLNNPKGFINAISKIRTPSYKAIKKIENEIFFNADGRTHLRFLKQLRKINKNIYLN